VRFDDDQETLVRVVREDGTEASEEDIVEFEPETTRTYYGNHPARLGTLFLLEDQWRRSTVRDRLHRQSVRLDIRQPAIGAGV
jgi:hypothetical protein